MTRWAVAVSSLALLAAVAGCTDSGTPGATGAAAVPASHADGRQPVVADDPGRPLALPAASQKVLYRTEGRRGSASLTVLPQVDRGTLGIVVLCSGPGGVLVHVGGVASFGVGCGANPGVYNEIALGTAKKSVSLSVTGSTQNEWAVTVGWEAQIDVPRAG